MRSANRLPKSRWITRTFLAQALQTEWQGRFQRGIEARLRQARFPWIKTLDQFDFDFQPSLDRKQVRELAGMSFVERSHNVILLGPPGVGKTHLAIALGVKAVEAGYSVLFLTLEQLMTRLVKAFNENRLERSLQQLVLSQGADHRRDRLPASLQHGSQPVLPPGGPPLRTRQPDRHHQQELPGLGRESSTTRSSPPPSSTGSCTTPPRSTSRARATGSRKNARPGCWDALPWVQNRRHQPRREFIAFRPLPGQKEKSREVSLCPGNGACVGAQVALQRCPILRTGKRLLSPVATLKNHT